MSMLPTAVGGAKALVLVGAAPIWGWCPLSTARPEIVVTALRRDCYRGPRWPERQRVGCSCAERAGKSSASAEPPGSWLL
jgi:hypothetical protein